MKKLRISILAVLAFANQPFGVHAAQVTSEKNVKVTKFDKQLAQSCGGMACSVLLSEDGKKALMIYYSRAAKSVVHLIRPAQKEFVSQSNGRYLPLDNINSASFNEADGLNAQMKASETQSKGQLPSQGIAPTPIESSEYEYLVYKELSGFERYSLNLNQCPLVVKSDTKTNKILNYDITFIDSCNRPKPSTPPFTYKLSSFSITTHRPPLNLYFKKSDKMGSNGTLEHGAVTSHLQIGSTNWALFDIGKVGTRFKVIAIEAASYPDEHNDFAVTSKVGPIHRYDNLLDEAEYKSLVNAIAGASLRCPLEVTLSPFGKILAFKAASPNCR